MTTKRSGLIVGFRHWRVVLDSVGNLALGSQYTEGHAWPAEPSAAGCLLSEHQAPARRCGCGWYAHHRARQLLYPTGAGIISGAVVGWGRVQCHAKGWRAEHARVVALQAPLRPSAARIVRLLSDRYDAPMVDAAYLEDAALEHGERWPFAAQPMIVDVPLGS